MTCKLGSNMKWFCNISYQNWWLEPGRPPHDGTEPKAKKTNFKFSLIDLKIIQKTETLIFFITITLALLSFFEWIIHCMFHSPNNKLPKNILVRILLRLFIVFNCDWTQRSRVLLEVIDLSSSSLSPFYEIVYDPISITIENPEKTKFLIDFEELSILSKIIDSKEIVEFEQNNRFWAK